MSKEAMKLALEALKQIDEAMPFPVAKLAQAAIKEALAEQPAQIDCCANCLRPKREHRGEACPKPYTTDWSAWDYEQPAQQVVDSNEKAGAYMDARLWEFIDMAAAWPKASPDPRTWNHVVVYAPKPAQQEPVAWIIEYEVRAGGTNRGSSLKKFDYVWHKCSFVSEDKDGELDAITWRNRKETPLYTSPPAQRTWVGLTDEEVTDIWAESSPYYHEDDFARAIEAKLKEKNT